MASATKKPTGLSITRSDSNYTLSWKIASKNHGGGQKLQYRHNGVAWIDYSVGKTTTSVVLTLGNVCTLEFRIRGKRKAESGKSYEYSDWASVMWAATVPAAPTLTYKNEGSDKGVFEWTCPSSTTDNAVVDHAEYQTGITYNENFFDYSKGEIQRADITGSVLKIENAQALAESPFIRWFRVRSVGPMGASEWANAYHAYGMPNPAAIQSATAANYGSSTRVTVSWRVLCTARYAIDKIKTQYVIAVPGREGGLTPPDSGWSDMQDNIAPRSLNEVSMSVSNVDAVIGDDECIWVRVVTEHDGLLSYSVPAVAGVGKLQAPTIDAVPDTSTGEVQITIVENTPCEAAATAIFFRPENDPANDRIVAILRRGTTSTTVNVPEVVGAAHTCFGAYAFIGIHIGTTISMIWMRSGSALDSDIPAIAPTGIAVVTGPEDGTVRVSWNWTWAEASYAELSWSDSEWAWESTAEPSKYSIEPARATSWIVAGLEIGKRWYFRVRLISDDDENQVTGPWSEMVYFDLESAPGRPVLMLSKSLIEAGDSITARWAVAASGSDKQVYAEICLATYDSETGDPVYGGVIASAGEEQHLEIEHDWEDGQTYYLAVRTTMASGIQSDWSELISVYVAEPASIVLESSNITFGEVRYSGETYTEEIPDDPWQTTYSIDAWEDPTWDSAASANTQLYNMYLNSGEVQTRTVIAQDGTVTYTRTTREATFTHTPRLIALPLTATVKGAGRTGTTVLSIVRAQNRHMERPDGKERDGYEGEIIATHSQVGEAQISIGVDDLVGSLDDGAEYYLTGKMIDAYGRSASFRYPFQIVWREKAVVPDVTVALDEETRIARITPQASGAPEGSTVDIYRLSADRPELIIKGGALGTTYVDPYPAFGGAGGHRVVVITPNGDYVTENGLGWYDAGEADGDILNDSNMVIDVDGEQIELPYNLELSNKWNKDFKRTSYLGGSVQGDWNPAVTRDLSVNTVLVRGDDLENQLAMRRLAGYAGVAHVRTPDGSSLTVNVQIDERQSYDTRRADYTLTMQAIDPEVLDGLTLAEWEAMQAE